MQHPIGQGCFHTGVVSLEDIKFNYVYDCGSDNLSVLREQIARFAGQLGDSGIDALFVSHLHSDHVCGLEFLLPLVKVNTVVLPYLSPVSRLLIIAKECASGDLSGSQIELLCDPGRWFRNRGVERIIYITNTPPDITPEWGTTENSPLIPPDSRRVKEQKVMGLELIIDALPKSTVDATFGKDDSSSSHFVSCGQPLRIAIKGCGCTLNWQFITFVHPEDGRTKDFLRHVRHLFGRTLCSSKRFIIDQKDILSILQSPIKRDCLASCYMAIRKNINLTSMSLYSGPISADSIVIHYTRLHSRIVRSGRVDRAGWLATGDADLRRDSRREAFVRHFQSLQNTIMSFVLPHHGSRYNFHHDLSDWGYQHVLAFGLNNRHGHPDPEVITANPGHPSISVTEASESILCERVVI